MALEQRLRRPTGLAAKQEAGANRNKGCCCATRSTTPEALPPLPGFQPALPVAVPPPLTPTPASASCVLSAVCVCVCTMEWYNSTTAILQLCFHVYPCACMDVCVGVGMGVGAHCCCWSAAKLYASSSMPRSLTCPLASFYVRLCVYCCDRA